MHLGIRKLKKAKLVKHKERLHCEVCGSTKGELNKLNLDPASRIRGSKKSEVVKLTFFNQQWMIQNRCWYAMTTTHITCGVTCYTTKLVLLYFTLLSRFLVDTTDALSLHVMDRQSGWMTQECVH